MFIVVFSIISGTWTAITVQVIQIVASVVIVALGLIIGLILRSKLLHHLKNSALDGWLVQTLGVLVVLPTLILACITLPLILQFGRNTVGQLLNQATQFLFGTEFPSLMRNLLSTLIIAALGIGAARTVQVLTIRGLNEKRVDINIRTLFGRIFYIITLIITIFWILAIWNISVGIPVAAFGIVTAAVIVSIQDVLKDLVAGLYILLERPFYIGNIISIATYLGRVEDVQLRTTKLRLISGEEVSIPNSLVFSGTVVNTSYYSERRATIKIDVPKEDFVAVETAQKILAALKEIEGVRQDKETTTLFSGYANDKMTLTIRFWVANQQNAVISEVMYALHMLLPNAELTVVDFAGNV